MMTSAAVSRQLELEASDSVAVVAWALLRYTASRVTVTVLRVPGSGCQSVAGTVTGPGSESELAGNLKADSDSESGGGPARYYDSVVVVAAQPETVTVTASAECHGLELATQPEWQ